jgi:hypothetical protein
LIASYSGTAVELDCAGLLRVVYQTGTVPRRIADRPGHRYFLWAIDRTLAADQACNTELTNGTHGQSRCSVAALRPESSDHDEPPGKSFSKCVIWSHLDSSGHHVEAIRDTPAQALGSFALFTTGRTAPGAPAGIALANARRILR